MSTHPRSTNLHRWLLSKTLLLRKLGLPLLRHLPPLRKPLPPSPLLLLLQ